MSTTACVYCDAMRAPMIDPFSGEPVCDECFNLLIGGNPDDEPWRCGYREARQRSDYKEHQ